MTTQRLFGILKLIDSLDRDLRLQLSLEQIRDALNNIVSAPAQPQHQSALASALTSFTDAAAKMARSISPSDASAIEQMGGAEFFDPAIAEKVTSSIQTNAMTPSVARDFVQRVVTGRATFLGTVKAALQSLEKLGITDSAVKPGTAEVAFLIPRDLFDNELHAFAKELTFISRLVQHVTEAQTGEAGPVKLDQLSSSVPTVMLMADLVVLGTLATVIDKFLKAWERIEKIRQIRTQLSDMGLKGAALQQLTDDITTTVEQVIEESTELVISNYKGSRKNELENAIRGDTKRLFGQIERGLTVEFRAQPEAGVEDPSQKVLQQIVDVGKTLKFPQIANDPLLLKAGEIIGNDDGSDVVMKHTKKTTTKKTTTQKHAAAQKEQESGGNSE